MRRNGSVPKRKHRRDALPKVKIWDIYSISDALAHSIGFLGLKKICECKRISKIFLNRCTEALKQKDEFSDAGLEHFDCDLILGTLIRNCPNLTKIRIEIPGPSDCLAITVVWRNLISMNIHGSISGNRTLQNSIIPQIAKSLRNLRVLRLIDVFSIPSVNVKPLQSLDLEVFTFFCNDDLEEQQKLIGVDSMLNKCAIESLGVDESCDIFHVMELCDDDVLRRIDELTIFAPRVSAENCAVLASKMPNLTQLTLSSSGISNEGIGSLVLLDKLEELTMDFSSMTPIGMAYLSSHNIFPKLRKLCWHGELPFELAWLTVLEKSRSNCDVARWY